MPDEKQPRGGTRKASPRAKPKQKTQPKPLGALREEARSEIVTERAQAFEANAVLAKYKHPGGAPSKRTPETIATILHCLEIGMSYKRAAAIAGIHFDTLNEWKKNDPELSDQFKRARVELERRMLEKLSAHTDEDLKAIQYTLERICDPAKYGKKIRPISIEMLDKPIDEGAPGKVYRVAFLGPNGELMNAESVSNAG